MTDWNRGMYTGEAQADAVPPLTVVPHEPVLRRRSQDRKGWEVFHDGRWLPEHEARAAGAYDRPIPTHTPSVVVKRQAPKEEEPMTTATCAQCGATFTYEREPGRAGRFPVTCSPECHRERTRATKRASAQRRRHAASATEVPATPDPVVAEHETEDQAPDDALSVAPQSSDQQVTDDDRNDPVDHGADSLRSKANEFAVVADLIAEGASEPPVQLHQDGPDATPLAPGDADATPAPEASGPTWEDWRRDAFTTALDEAQADYEQAARDAAAAIEARNVAQVAVSYLRAKLDSLEEADAA